MNILSDLTRHMVMASRNLKIEPKLTPPMLSPSIGLSEDKTIQILPPTPIHEALLPSMMMQKPEIKAIPLESMVSAHPIPTPVQSLPKPSFNLGSIEGLAEDNSVSMIVCDGPLKPVKIKREGRLEQTSIVLSRPEIDYVIGTFSRKSNLPIRPVFRASMENLSILALVSSIESRFMLTVNH